MSEYPSCQQCGAPMNHSPKRGGWYYPECRMVGLENEVSTLRHDLRNEQAASRMAHEVVARNKALEAENAQLRHALGNAQAAAGFAKDIGAKAKVMSETLEEISRLTPFSHEDAETAIAWAKEALQQVGATNGK